MRLFIGYVSQLLGLVRRVFGPAGNFPEFARQILGAAKSLLGTVKRPIAPAEKSTPVSKPAKIAQELLISGKLLEHQMKTAFLRAGDRNAIR